MKNDKRGLSQIIIIVVVVALALVAIGILWNPLSNMLNEGLSDADLSSKCLEVSVNPTALSCDEATNPTDCDVTVKRTATGEAIDGVRVSIENADGTESHVENFEGNIEPTATETLTTEDTMDISEGAKVTVTPYFVAESGENYYCSSGSSYTA